MEEVRELHLYMRMHNNLIPLKFTIDSDIDSFLKFKIDASGSGVLPYYDGDYVVDPRKVLQQLETNQKSMNDDVTVNPIFYSEVSNPQGGNTVTIGLE